MHLHEQGAACIADRCFCYYPPVRRCRPDDLAASPAMVIARRDWWLHRWWQAAIVAPTDHPQVIERIVAESGWSGRYAFMTMMSAGIAVLGLLLSSPAVVIGAMLISPLMSPILGLGFSLALFNFREMRRSLTALIIGSAAAVAFSALIVLASPLKAATPEILGRTRPNLFDLLVALFAALAGTLAIIRGRGDTIVGVAIATALMPPLAVVGYGLATGNMVALTGALALFATNLLTIALAATIVARFFGFGHHLSSRQGWAQSLVLLLVFVAMAVPLAISLGRIGRQAITTTQVRSFLSDSFGARARVTQLEIDFEVQPLGVRAVVIAPRNRAKPSKVISAGLAQRLGRPVRLQLDEVLLAPSAGSADAQRAELEQGASDAAGQASINSASGSAVAVAAAGHREADSVARLVALAAGVPVAAVTVDRDQQRASASAAPLAGADAQTYRALEQRAAAAADGWQVTIVPPLEPLPQIHFADNVAALDATASAAVELSAWEAQRWNIAALAVPGLPGGALPPAHPTLSQRRGLAVAAMLAKQAIRLVPAPAAGQTFALAPARPLP